MLMELMWLIAIDFIAVLAVLGYHYSMYTRNWFGVVFAISVLAFCLYAALLLRDKAYDHNYKPIIGLVYVAPKPPSWSLPCVTQ
jgi:hypothetical protein